jgi:hypothetical protein
MGPPDLDLSVFYNQRGSQMTRKEAFRDCLLLLCGKLPEDELIPEESWSALDYKRSVKLQDFVAENVKLPWGTGIGTLEAIDHMVDEAESNGNLRDHTRLYE